MTDGHSKSTTTLRFASLEKIRDHFLVPTDDTLWVPGEYEVCVDTRGKKTGLTPVRKRAPFQTLTRGMSATSEIGENLSETYGLYLLSFDLPFPAIYVGIAASSGRSPEGILSRIRKHRIKLTASHVGASATTHGGVNHTSGWRDFATHRAVYYAEHHVADQWQDGRFACGLFQPSGAPCSHKKQAEWFESQLIANDGVMGQIVQLLWSDVELPAVFWLTKSTSSGLRPREPRIELWDGTGFVL